MTPATPVLPRRAVLAAATTLAAPAVFAQGKFPDRPIRFLIPWPPGGALDALHRQMFEIMGRDLGQSVILENRPGARGTQAAIFLINQAKPDGYTLAHHHLSVLRHPFLTKQPTWDPIADFTYIMQVSGFLFGTAVRSDSPYKTFRDLIDAAKRRPGQLSYSTSGIATSNHIAMEEILERDGAEMTHIPFRGSQEGVTALLGKQIDVVADSSSWKPNVEAGELRLLSVWTRDRVPSFPDAPTLPRTRLRHGRHLALWNHRPEGRAARDREHPPPRLPQGAGGRSLAGDHAPVGDAAGISRPRRIPRLRQGARGLREAHGGAAEAQHRLKGMTLTTAPGAAISE